MNALADLFPDVRPVENELFMFDVRSETKAFQWYRVNLRDNGWGGWCNCPVFGFKYGPALSRGALPTDKNRCKHIRRARSYFFDLIAPKILAALTPEQRRAVEMQGP